MHFALSPNTKNTTQLEETKKTQTVLMTEDGGIEVTIDWLSEALEPGKESEVLIRFYDAFAGASIEADVIYDLRVQDKLGNQLLPRYNQTAANATDIQRITFPSNDTYYLEINVRGIVIADEDNNASQQSPSSLDTSRAGIARAIVVVPEFPNPVFLTSSILAGLLLLIKLRRQPN